MLITEEYREMQRKLHENPKYGAASLAYAPIVAEVIGLLRRGELLDATELLDYGAGKGHLGPPSFFDNTKIRFWICRFQ